MMGHKKGIHPGCPNSSELDGLLSVVVYAVRERVSGEIIVSRTKFQLHSRDIRQFLGSGQGKATDLGQRWVCVAVQTVR